MSTDEPVVTSLPATIALLPFFVGGRYPRPDLLGQCRGDAVRHTSGRELVEQVRDISLGLAGLGMARADRVAIIAESRPEWLLTDFAILIAGAVTVPIYPTLSVEQVAFILRDSGARLAVASTAAQVEKLCAAAALAPELQTIVSIEPSASAGGASPHVISIADVISAGHRTILDGWGVGKAVLDAAKAVSPDDLATIIYTSGTSGDPKGVELTHANLIANVAGCIDRLQMDERDTALSFLPLCHSFERMAAYLYLASGVSIVFAESNDTVPRDMLAVKPTLMTAVPRVFEKIYARIVDRGRASGIVSRRIFTWATAVAQRAGASGTPEPTIAWRLADRLVFRKIRDGVGGRIRYFVSGSAPLRKDLAEFFYGVGLPILEGYGMTETAPVVAVTPFGRVRPGTVGPPLVNVHVRIADDGEILVQGPNVMRGYFHKPAETAAALEGGWMHTGDVGDLDEAGYLRITDRKKELLVTSGGKKIAPQAIEARLRDRPIVAEAVLVGDGRHFPSAIIVPDRAAVARLVGTTAASGAHLDSADPWIATLASAVVQAAFQQAVDEVNAPLAQFERIKKFHLVPDEWTIASGVLTPTLKVRRRIVEARYRAEIDRLYA